MSQRQQLERVLEIDRQIRAQLYPNAAKLAKQFEVSRRVIFTDRQFLIDRLAAPLAYDHKHGGWYYTAPTFALPSVLVTEGEFLAFLLSVELARRYVGTALEAPLLAAVEKLSRGMKTPVNVDLESLRSHFTFTAPAVLSADPEVMLDLHTALRDGRKVRVVYYSASRGKRTGRVLDPYHLCNIRGDWYLIAYDSLRKQVRNFHAGRIEKCTLLPQHFRQDPAFSMKKWMATAFQSERKDRAVDVAIRFDEYQSRWIRERQWHETQRIEEQPDGGLILRLRTALTSELMRWILQFGSHAEVVKPQILRQMISSQLSGLTKAYRKEKPEQAS